MYVRHMGLQMCGVLCCATVRTQSSNLRSSSLGNLLIGFHWEQDGRLKSKSIHPHHSIFPPSPLTHASHVYFWYLLVLLFCRRTCYSTLESL